MGKNDFRSPGQVLYTDGLFGSNFGRQSLGKGYPEHFGSAYRILIFRTNRRNLISAIEQFHRLGTDKLNRISGKSPIKSIRLGMFERGQQRFFIYSLLYL